MSIRHHRILAAEKPFDLRDFDGLLVPVPAKPRPSDPWDGALALLPKAVAARIAAFAKKTHFKPKAKANFALDLDETTRVVVFCFEARDELFPLLTAARAALEPLGAASAKKLLLDTRAFPAEAAALADAFVSAVVARNFKFSKYTTKDSDKKAEPKVNLAILSTKDVLGEVRDAAGVAESMTHGTNLVRRLSMQAGNDLNPGQYVRLIREIAKTEGLTFEHYTIEKLRGLGAGAFLAVAEAQAKPDGGIVRLTHNPKTKVKGSLPRVHLVGKGVTFDTGGINVKSDKHMFTMNGDMAGSAVVLALVLMAKEEDWPIRIDAWMAIAENLLAPSGYKPNDVVTSLKGLTIEIVHSDAEGRMLLADTLTMAQKEGGDMILDFATLTGACISSLGTAYSGVFSNRKDLLPALTESGVRSGERVWPFPMDEDFADCLESEIADLLQCRLSGGVDHIEAALFLKKFVGEEIPWVHFDLAAARNTGGLAHIDTPTTGVGVRVATKFLKGQFKL